MAKATEPFMPTPKSKLRHMVSGATSPPSGDGVAVVMGDPKGGHHYVEATLEAALALGWGPPEYLARRLLSYHQGPDYSDADVARVSAEVGALAGMLAEAREKEDAGGKKGKEKGKTPGEKMRRAAAEVGEVLKPRRRGVTK